MDELLDILTENAEPTGVTTMKSEAHRKGLFHATVHIWFYTKGGEVLLQKRAFSKDIHPGLWDVSVAGHVGAGEIIENSAIREVQEEIGLAISKEQLIKIGVFKSVQKHSDILIDCEFHHTFLSELKVSLEDLTKQQSEIDALKFLSISQFEKELNGLDKTTRYVPHDPAYYPIVLKEIKNLL
jgi:isopentenyldiphosphate isomerase